MEQLICHLVGDYILQSDRMASRKVGSWPWALAHGFVYTMPFWLVFRPSLAALGVIALSHALVDRYRLARFVVAAKNSVDCKPEIRSEFWSTPTGYGKATPDWLAFWLLIICDNTIHLVINYLCLRYL